MPLDLPGVPLIDAGTGSVARLLPYDSVATPADVSEFPELCETPCCYALLAAEAGAMKLGKTGALAARWKALQTAAPEPLRLVAVWLTDDNAATEAELHRRFAAWRRKGGEWFEAAPVVEYLTAVLFAGAAGDDRLCEAVTVAANAGALTYTVGEHRLLQEALDTVMELRRAAYARRPHLAGVVPSAREVQPSPAAGRTATRALRGAVADRTEKVGASLVRQLHRAGPDGMSGSNLRNGTTSRNRIWFDAALSQLAGQGRIRREGARWKIAEGATSQETVASAVEALPAPPAARDISSDVRPYIIGPSGQPYPNVRPPAALTIPPPKWQNASAPVPSPAVMTVAEKGRMTPKRLDKFTAKLAAWSAANPGANFSLTTLARDIAPGLSKSGDTRPFLDHLLVTGLAEQTGTRMYRLCTAGAGQAGCVMRKP